MPLEYTSPEASKPGTGLRCCLTTFGGGVAIFIGWCVLDYILVHFAPSHMDDFDWTFILFPIVVGIVTAATLRHVDAGTRVVLSIGAAVLASVIAVVLFLLVGIPFHLSIGGKL